MSHLISHFLSLWWHWSLGETYFLLVKNLYKGGSLPAADERTGTGRNILSASLPGLYFAHTWRVLEYKRNHFYIFGYQRSSHNKSGTLQKLAFYQEVTDSRNKVLSPLPSSNWKDPAAWFGWCVQTCPMEKAGTEEESHPSTIQLFTTIKQW